MSMADFYIENGINPGDEDIWLRGQYEAEEEAEDAVKYYEKLRKERVSIPKQWNGKYKIGIISSFGSREGKFIVQILEKHRPSGSLPPFSTKINLALEDFREKVVGKCCLGSLVRFQCLNDTDGDGYAADVEYVSIREPPLVSNVLICTDSMYMDDMNYIDMIRCAGSERKAPSFFTVGQTPLTKQFETHGISCKYFFLGDIGAIACQLATNDYSSMVLYASSLFVDHEKESEEANEDGKLDALQDFICKWVSAGGILLIHTETSSDMRIFQEWFGFQWQGLVWGEKDWYTLQTAFRHFDTSSVPASDKLNAYGVSHVDTTDQLYQSPPDGKCVLILKHACSTAISDHLYLLILVHASFLLCYYCRRVSSCKGCA